MNCCMAHQGLHDKFKPFHAAISPLVK